MCVRTVQLYWCNCIYDDTQITSCGSNCQNISDNVDYITDGYCLICQQLCYRALGRTITSLDEDFEPLVDAESDLEVDKKIKCPCRSCGSECQYVAEHMEYITAEFCLDCQYSGQKWSLEDGSLYYRAPGQVTGTVVGDAEQKIASESDAEAETETEFPSPSGSETDVRISGLEGKMKSDDGSDDELLGFDLYE